MSISVLLVDDHTIVRDGLRTLLEREMHLTVVGVADDGREAVRRVSELEPDVVIMDVTMPGLNGMDASRQILADYPQVKIIALTMHTDPQYIVGMLNAGAMGYLVKNCPMAEVVEAINTVLTNRRYFSADITRIVSEHGMQQWTTSGASADARLSQREREVLRMLAEGTSNGRIADLLHLSIHTVIAHRRHIMEKLYIDNLADLTKYAIREGLTKSDAVALTGREREVLQLLAEGQSTGRIAVLLHLSAKTIATHREHLMRKLGAQNIADLTRYALREGLTSLER